MISRLLVVPEIQNLARNKDKKKEYQPSFAALAIESSIGKKATEKALKAKKQTRQRSKTWQ